MDIDDKIRRGIKIAGWSMFALFLSPFVVVLAVRNLPPDAGRQAALELLRRPTPPVRGRDGSDALWLVRYDVPPAQQAETAARLRAYLVRHDQLQLEKREAEAAKLTDPRKQLVEFAKVEGDPDWLCPQQDLGCLAAVRKNPEAAAAAIQQRAAGLDALSRLTGFDGVRYGVVPTFSQELPSSGNLIRLLRTRHALEFAQGRQAEAVSGVCRELAGWRRLGADTDMLVLNMVFAAYARQDLQLLSEMLAELPPPAALPADCTSALAPARPQELDLCPAIKGEFRAVERLYNEDMLAETTPGGRRLVKIAVGRAHAAAVMAPAYAAYCEAPMHQAASLDRPAATSHPAKAKCALLEKIGDPIGCWLAEMSAEYSGYQDRRTDLAAQVALMRTLAWVRAHGTGTQADFDKRPDALGLRRHAEVSADGREVSIPLFDRRKGDRWALQLQPAPAG
jgi:hypothetical protein